MSTSAVNEASLPAWPYSVNDDPEFVSECYELVCTAADAYGVDYVRLIHINNWFSKRWLGFRGKIMGAFGVHSYVDGTKPGLTIPPFVPKRILVDISFSRTHSQRGWDLTPTACVLHARRSGETNSRMALAGHAAYGLYVWYSGNTKRNDRGSIMVYVHVEDVSTGWYVELHKCDAWHLSNRVGIGEAEWSALRKFAVSA